MLTFDIQDCVIRVIQLKIQHYRRMCSVTVVKQTVSLAEPLCWKVNSHSVATIIQLCNLHCTAMLTNNIHGVNGIALIVEAELHINTTITIPAAMSRTQSTGNYRTTVLRIMLAKNHCMSVP